MPRKTALRLHLDDDLAQWLRSEAARRRTSVSHVMRELVLDAIEDRRDAEIAHRRMAEIDADPSSVVSGNELETKLNNWVQPLKKTRRGRK